MRSGTESYYHYDGEYSTRDLTDANENVTDTFIYTAYGEEVARTGTTTNPFGYKGAVGYYSNELTNDVYVRNRTYEPAIGRWLSADPLGFVDGSSLYRGYFSPNAIDPSGKITVTATEQNLNVECGETVSIKWIFALDQPAPCDGYIVQRVAYRCTVDESCEDCPNSSPVKPDLVFWEAWDVKKGDKVSPDTKRDGYSDGASMTAFDDTCGNQSAVGTIKFFCKDKTDPAAGGIGTGDIGTVGTGRPASGWDINQSYAEGK